MRRNSYTSLGILLGSIAIILLLISLNKKRDTAGETDKPTNPASQQMERGSLADYRDRMARSRRPQIGSAEEAERALLDFDLTSISGSDREEARRCLDRFRSLTARIPEEFYSELAVRFGVGADNDLKQHVRQMAIYQEWGRKDLEAASADLSAIEDERRFLKALHSVLVGAMDEDAEAAMKIAETIDIEPDGLGDFERTDLMDTIFDNWIESDPISALEWVKQAPVADKRRDQWIADGLRTLRETDPDAAERWREQEKFEGFKP